LILYDQNYNFLAISSETVSFLGYENVDEFVSLHSDFADLLIPKDGKIYKFKNFSWIDFILYSGAPNKSAVIKTKDGTEIDIKLTVKELTLTREIDGLNKCFAVRIISDEFVKIASKVNANMKFEARGNIALSNLLSEPSAAKSVSLDLKQQNDSKTSSNKEKTEDEPLLEFPPKEELRSLVMDDINELDNLNDKEEKTEEEPLIEFPSKEELDSTTVDDTNRLDITIDENSNEDIMLDFTKDKSDTTPNEKQDIDLSFLKIKDDISSDDLANENDSALQSSNLDFLRTDTKNEPNQIQSQEKSPDLSFLKESNSFESDEQKEEVIKRIKDDLNEIDQIKEESNQNSLDEKSDIIESGLFIRRVFDKEELES
jgi:hypothetical protein